MSSSSKHRAARGTCLDFEDEKWWLEGVSSSDEEEGEENEDQNTALKEKKHQKQLDWEVKWKKKFDELYRTNITKPSMLILGSFNLVDQSREKTDAILSCPGCFNILCDKCQG